MRFTVLIGLALFTFACGDDTGGAGGGSGGGSTTSASSGDGGGGPTTTGAGGIDDDGTEETIDACNAALATSQAVSDELGCELENDPEFCNESAPGWVPCVDEWNAYYLCIEPVTTADNCDCAQGGILCDWEASCGDALAALEACGV